MWYCVLLYGVVPQSTHVQDDDEGAGGDDDDDDDESDEDLGTEHLLAEQVPRRVCFPPFFGV